MTHDNKRKGHKKTKGIKKKCPKRKKIAKRHLPQKSITKFASCERERKNVYCDKEKTKNPEQNMDIDCEISKTPKTQLMMKLSQIHPSEIDFKTAFYIVNNVSYKLVPLSFRQYWDPIFDSWKQNIKKKPRKQWSDEEKLFDRFLRGGKTKLKSKTSVFIPQDLTSAELIQKINEPLRKPEPLQNPIIPESQKCVKDCVQVIQNISSQVNLNSNTKQDIQQIASLQNKIQQKDKEILNLTIQLEKKNRDIIDITSKYELQLQNNNTEFIKTNSKLNQDVKSIHFQLTNANKKNETIQQRMIEKELLISSLKVQLESIEKQLELERKKPPISIKFEPDQNILIQNLNEQLRVAKKETENQLIRNTQTKNFLKNQKKKNNELEKELYEKKEAFNELQIRFEESERDLKFAKEIFEIKKNAYKNQIKILKQTNELLQKEKIDLQEVYEESEKRAKEYKNLFEESLIQNKNLKKQIEKHETSIYNLTTQLHALQIQVIDFENQILDLKDQIETQVLSYEELEKQKIQIAIQSGVFRDQINEEQRKLIQYKRKKSEQIEILKSKLEEQESIASQLANEKENWLKKGQQFDESHVIRKIHETAASAQEVINDLVKKLSESHENIENLFKQKAYIQSEFDKSSKLVDSLIAQRDQHHLEYNTFIKQKEDEFNQKMLAQERKYMDSKIMPKPNITNLALNAMGLTKGIEIEIRLTHHEIYLMVKELWKNLINSGVPPSNATNMNWVANNFNLEYIQQKIPQMVLRSFLEENSDPELHQFIVLGEYLEETKDSFTDINLYLKKQDLIGMIQIGLAHYQQKNQNIVNVPISEIYQSNHGLQELDMDERIFWYILNSFWYPPQHTTIHELADWIANNVS